MANEEKKIIRENWVSDFVLVGRPVINDFTFKIDAQSTKSDWIYNSMNLGVNCGEKYGTIYAEMMGGYSPSREGEIFAHGKKDDKGTDDYKNSIKVPWSERFNPDILETLGRGCFIPVGLEKTVNGETYVERFLSEYDAIAYIKKHLTEDMVVNIRGQLNYSSYKGNTQVKKVIQSIFLSRVEDPSEFHANFRQSILIDEDSASLSDVDKDTGTLYVNARVLDYLRDYKGVEVKGQFPYTKMFEYNLDMSKKELNEKIFDKLFKVKKNITQITWEGEFIEGGAMVTVTYDDLPDEIKDLIDIGAYTEEDAIAKCATNSSRERKMVLVKPYCRMVGDDDNKELLLQKFEDQYTEDDLDMSWVYSQAKDEDDSDVPFDEGSKSNKSNSVADDDWLSAIINA